MKTSRKHAGIWFQSTHSLRSATSNGKKISLAATFQSTHSLRSATVGWNNGLHVITEDKNGEPLDYLLHNGGGDPVENEYGITGDLAAVDDRFDEEQGNLIFRTLVDGKIDTYPWELEQKGGAENETDA